MVGDFGITLDVRVADSGDPSVERFRPEGLVDPEAIAGCRVKPGVYVTRRRLERFCRQFAQEGRN